MRVSVVGLMTAVALATTSALAAGPNKVAGTWRPTSATIDAQGATTNIYGPVPVGQLIFTENLRYSVILHDPRIARFASDVRGEGTDAENRAAFNGSIALYGSCYAALPLRSELKRYPTGSVSRPASGPS